MRRVEVVVDLDIDLLSSEVSAGSEYAFRSVAVSPNPSITRRIETVADLIVVGRRHFGQKFRQVAGGIERLSVRVPVRARLDNGVGAIRPRWDVCDAAKDAHVTESAAKCRASHTRVCRGCQRVAQRVDDSNGRCVACRL